MQIASYKKFKDFYEIKGHEDARISLERWHDIVEKLNGQPVRYSNRIRKTSPIAKALF